jgi:PKD domain-containing protein
MYKKILIASLALIAGLASCKKDDPTPSPNPPSTLTIDGVASTLEFYQLDTAHLSVAGVAKDAAAKAVWAVNGAKAAEGATFDFTTAHPGKYEVTLTVDGKSAKRTYTVAPRFSEGAFLLNEGNSGNETGSLTYIHPSKKLVIDQAYFHINGTKLGNVCQDLAFGNDKVYIISQNGPRNGGEGLLTIAEAGSLKKVKVYNDATLAQKWPTHIAVIRDHIYLRADYKATPTSPKGCIYRGTEDGGFTLIPETEGVMKMRMAQIGERLFALTSDSKVLMIQGTQVVRELDLSPAKPTGIAVSHDGKLWVSTTSPNAILKVDPTPDNFVALDTHVLDKSISATGPQSWERTTSSAFFAHGDKLYFTGQSSVIYCHDFATSKTSQVIDVKTIDGVGTSANQYYNSLGVDPATGELYYAAFEDYSTYNKKNVTMVLKADGTKLLLKEKVNSFPAGFYFIPNAASRTGANQ